MKQKQLLRTLLAAVCLLVGQSAWADDVYTEVYQRTSVEGTNQWASADVTDWGSVTDLTIDANNYFGFTSGASAARNASYTISAIEKNAKVKYVVEWYVQNTNGGYGAMYSYLQLGNLFIRVADNSQNNDIGFSTDAGATYCNDLQSSKTKKWVRSGNLVTVTAILNTANNVVESMTVVMDGTTYTTTNLTTTSLSGANNKVIGLGNTSTRSGRSASLIKSITVSQCQQAVTEANYTINYQLNGTTVKTVAGTSVVGATITADVAVDATAEGYIGNHYLTIADEAPSITLTAGVNELNVPVRAPRTATVKVTKTVGGVEQTPEETIFTETDGKVCAWNYFYSMYVKDGENYYKADDVSKFGESGTFTEDGQVIERTVAYALDTDAKIFVEAESTNTNSSNNINYSGGKTGYVKGGNSYSLGTLPAGIYNLSVYLQDNGNRGIYLRSGSTTGTEIINLGTDKNSSAGVYNKNFALTEETSLYLTGYTSGNSVNQCANIDYILVKAVEGFNVGDEIITNGSFATDTDGWTLVNYNRHATAGQNSTPVVESYGDNGRAAGSVTQSVGYLPAGNYVISASVLSGAESYLKVLNASDDSEIASIECTGSWYDKTVAKSFTLGEIKDVKVQFSTPAQSEETWWSYITNVSLIYYGSNTPVESNMAVSAPNKAKYGTFYAPYDVEIPTLIKAYTAQNNAVGTALTLTEINGTIPAYTPVILENNRSNDNAFNGTFYGITTEGTPASSALTGTLEVYTLQEGNYIMQYQNNETAFYLVSGDAVGKTIAANRCYIAAGQNAKAVNVIYLDSETTAINNVNAVEASMPVKRIVNGQLVIEKDGKQYNAMGQEK